ncbi:MAG: carboxypeptidase regulatory-like domain-containing protein [Chitinophagaceae bacterium]
MLRLISILLFIHFSVHTKLAAQETNSRASGRVLLENHETPVQATVTVIHEPTQNKYISVTQPGGYFDLFNLKPGGPYTILVSYTGYELLKKTNLFIHLSGEHFLSGDAEIIDFFLEKKIITLSGVVISSMAPNKGKNGIETTIPRSALQSMPSINRSFQDFVRMVPQAKVSGEGAMSLAGQNNRFNAFYIDGANNNDIQGLAVTGMNGGQTGSPPVSMEAIEEINILLAPYDVQYGNFTGGSINAVTRSGSNENKSSVWLFFRNEHLAGRSPQAVEKPGYPGEFYRPRLSAFSNQTFGGWNSGALLKNKLFYFVLLERQAELRPQPFDINEYRGNSNWQQLVALTDFLHNNYQYDPGSFLESRDQLTATRFNLKFDWNASIKNKFMLSYRYNDAQRIFAPRVSASNFIFFENSGIRFPARTHAVSFEWKHFFSPRMNNRMMLSYTNQNDTRRWIEQPFPNVTIADGNGSVVFGSEPGTGLNGLKARDLTLFNSFKYIKNKQVITIGTDINFTQLNNRSMLLYFGGYQFRSLSDFMGGAFPSRFQRSFYLNNEPGNPSKFSTLRTSFFATEEIKPGPDLKLIFGIRLDGNSIPPRTNKDPFFNDTAIQIITGFYDLERAVTGEKLRSNWSLSPRVSAEYKLHRSQILVKAGAGIFSGHIVNAWLFNVFNSVDGFIDINPQQSGLNFNPDPYQQPDPQSLGMDPSNLKGVLSLMAKGFKYPSVFRTSLAIEKKLKSTWAFSIEGIFTKNIQEAAFRNVNILPPAIQTSGPGARNTYSVSSFPPKIPLRSNGVNPYAGIYLLTNNSGKKGYSYSLSFIVRKQTALSSFNAGYTYGRSKVLFEMTGPQTPIASQWRNIETVNGRNFVTLSTSDNDLKHRVMAWVSKKINYPKSKMATTISLFYNGQSGTPYSYVYLNSLVNDNGKLGENFDLLYIPTVDDLASMSFLQFTDNSGNLFSAAQQKDLLNTFIESDNYLQKHRGEFAKRNGARLPFTHIADLHLQHDLIIEINRKKTIISISYDVFNFTNMLNRKWGRIYFLLNDSYPLITFTGYANTASPPVAQYQFKPFNGNPYSIQASSLPGNSARWISQLGLKFNLN